MLTSVKPHVFLVPGFFGFETLGELPYFAHVADVLSTRLAHRGVDARVRAVGTLPTASLRTRAAHLAAVLSDLTQDDDAPIHLVGHSSGGLDLRLLVTPSASLPTDVDVEALSRRVVSVTTVATPHYGTPLADAATSVLGQRLLKVLSLVTVHALRFGHHPLRGAVGLGKVLLRLDDLVGMREGVLNQLYEGLLADFSRERSDSLQEFLGHVKGDQALLPQLSPASMDVFNAASRDRDTVRYGSVVTRARPPGLGSMAALGVDPYAQVTHALYQVIYRITAGMPESALGPLEEEHIEALISGYGKTPDEHANDGMVPTRSQIWGHLLHIARADHLDVMGYFRDPNHDPPHMDWLATRSGFDRQRFSALWGAVARFIAGQAW